MHQEEQAVATLKKQMGEGNHAFNVSAAIIDQSNEVMSFLQVFPVSKQSGGNRLNPYAFLDSGSTVAFTNQSVQEKLRALITDVMLNIAGIQGETKDLETERVYLKIKGLHSKLHPIEAFAHPLTSLGNKNYIYKASIDESSTQKKFTSYKAHWIKK